MARAFPELLRALREARGISQNALARAVELSPSLVNMLESGERRPSRDAIRRIADALHLSPAQTDDLLVAGGQLPAVYDRVSPVDPDLLLVAGLLADPAIPERDRDQLRLLLRLVSLRWRPDALGTAAQLERPEKATSRGSAPATSPDEPPARSGEGGR